MQGKYQNFCQLAQISFSILLLYTPFFSAANLQAEIMEHDGYGSLGYYLLAVLYFFMGIGSFFSTAVMNKLGTRWCLVIGGLGNIVWICACIMPAHQAESDGTWKIPEGLLKSGLVTCAGINGFAVGILWATANSFVADCSSEKTKGLYFSYFWAFYMSSQIIGNLTAGCVIGGLDQEKYFIVMAVIASFATISLALTKKPVETVELQLERRLFRIDSMLSQHDDTHYDINTITNMFEEEQEEKETTVKEDIKSVFRMLISQRMRYLIPELLWTGISISVYTGLLVPIIYDTMPASKSYNEKFQASMMAMMTLGVGEVFGGIVMGYLVDKYGSKNTTYLNIFNTMMAAALVGLYLYQDSYSWLAFIMTFYWGLQDSCISIHIDSILGFEFQTTKEPFSVDSFMESITVFSFEMIQSLINGRQETIAYVFLVGLMGVMFNYCTLHFKFRQKSVIPENFLENYMSQKLNKVDPIHADSDLMMLSSTRGSFSTGLNTSIQSSHPL